MTSFVNSTIIYSAGG